MSQIIEANVFNIAENYHALISMINTVEKLSALQSDYIVKRFNSKVKIAVFAAKEISGRFVFLDESTPPGNTIELRILRELLNEFKDLARIMELGLDVEDFDYGTDMAELHYSYQGAFKALHRDISALNELLPANQLQAA